VRTIGCSFTAKEEIMKIYVAGTMGLEDVILFLNAKGVSYQIVLRDEFAGREASKPGTMGVIVGSVYGLDSIYKLLYMWGALGSQRFEQVGTAKLLTERRWWFLAAPKDLVDSPSVADLYEELSGNSVRRGSFSSVIDWMKMGGLVPVITQDAQTGEVLMLAYMNREAYEESWRTGRAVYYSRSREKIWRKGEESGHVQMIQEMRLDCDGDALILKVEQTGAACHEGYRTCFFRRIERDGSLSVIEERIIDPKQVYKK